MTRQRLLHRAAAPLALSATALALSGCAHLPERLSGLFRERQVEVRPIAATANTSVVDLKADAQPGPPPEAGPRSGERLYLQAMSALRARDYGRALDLLQMARNEDPSNGRILNALGVTYDKLGRFDLSERYYTAALQTDPRSKVVQSNMQYSAMLKGEQRALAQPAPPARLAVEVAPAPPTAVAMETAGVRFAQPRGEARIGTALLVGKPVMIVDASGGRGLGATVRSQLAQRGWSVGRGEASAMRPGGAVLRFPQQHAAAAGALARTLPFPVKLVACGQACDRLTLTLGASVQWKS